MNYKTVHWFPTRLVIIVCAIVITTKRICLIPATRRTSQNSKFEHRKDGLARPWHTTVPLRWNNGSLHVYTSWQVGRIKVVRGRPDTVYVCLLRERILDNILIPLYGNPTPYPNYVILDQKARSRKREGLEYAWRNLHHIIGLAFGQLTCIMNWYLCHKLACPPVSNVSKLTRSLNWP